MLAGRRSEELALYYRDLFFLHKQRKAEALNDSCIIIIKH